MAAVGGGIGDVGVALSGGGSRAVAFHRGTLRALHELDLMWRVERVSTVSGGSVFGAAWMSARAAGVSDEVFLEEMAGVLGGGFLIPALRSWRTVLLLTPGYTRTHRLAETFDALLMRGKRLADLPESPLLCMNATVMNHAQVARFSRGGISCIDLGADPGPGASLPEHPLAPRMSLGLATAASAAFPFGLPPVDLGLRDIPGAELRGDLAGHTYLRLTDGGVLENLGAQTLLRSRRFGARHLVVSDAGVSETPWRPGGLWARIESAGAYALSADTLSRLLNIMNSKENRSMRQLVVQELAPAMRAPQGRRAVLMARVAQRWDRMLERVPTPHLEALASAAGSSEKPPPVPSASSVRSFLERACGVDLGAARAIYDEMGGDAMAGEVDRVSTSFVGIRRQMLDALASHARWQLHASHAIYGPLPPP